MTKQTPGYGRDVITKEDLLEFRAEAERRGEVWEVRIEGDPISGYDAAEGAIFHAKSLHEAKEYAVSSAIDTARFLSKGEPHVPADPYEILRKLKALFETPLGEGGECIEIDNTEYEPCAYRLYHKGVLVYTYEPTK